MKRCQKNNSVFFLTEWSLYIYLYMRHYFLYHLRFEIFPSDIYTYCWHNIFSWAHYFDNNKNCHSSCSPAIRDKQILKLKTKTSQAKVSFSQCVFLLFCFSILHVQYVTLFPDSFCSNHNIIPQNRTYELKIACNLAFTAGKYVMNFHCLNVFGFFVSWSNSVP